MLIMSQVTVTTTTYTVTVVCSGALLFTMTAILAPTSMGQTTLGQHDVVLPTHLILRDTVRDSAGLTTMLQELLQFQMSSQAYTNYAMDPMKVGFSLRVEPSNIFLCHWLVSVMDCFLLSDSHVAAMFTSGNQQLGCIAHALSALIQLSPSDSNHIVGYTPLGAC